MITATSFARFGSAHLCVIALTVVTPLILSVIARLDSSEMSARLISLALVTLLVAAKVLGLIILHRSGDLTIESVLPLHLCDWAAITALVTLIHPNQWTYELCYFWGLGGTLQALLTPDLSQGFPNPGFISFFALHGGVIASVLFMTLGMGMRPDPTSIVHVMAWSTLYLGVALTANSVLGTNFGYLRAKPAQPSLLDYLAQWPLYVMEMALLAIVFILVLYAPFFIIDRLKT